MIEYSVSLCAALAAPKPFLLIGGSLEETSSQGSDDMQSWGYGSEIAARIGEELFDWLDAPVRRVAGMDSFVAYQPLLEDVILPQPEDLYKAMLEMAKY